MIFFLFEKVYKSGKKFVFQNESFESAQKHTYSGTKYEGANSVPVLSANSNTIFIVSDYCPRFDSTLTHEIGHLIYFSIEENHPVLAQKWSTLWTTAYDRAGSPDDPMSYIEKHCSPYSCPFMSWKDADNEHEGFADFVKDIYLKWQKGANNTHPDYIRKKEFFTKEITHYIKTIKQ